MDICHPLTAYQLDKACTQFGNIVENALSEREKTGSGKSEEWRPKYKLDEILSADFNLPRPLTPLQKRRQSAANFFAMAGQAGSGVKMWREIAPEQSEEVKVN